jgi:hypothetical protein
MTSLSLARREVPLLDNDDIEDAIEDSTEELVSNERAVARYEALVALWIHRDAMMHQMPSLILAAAAGVMALVFGQKSAEEVAALVNWQNWGDPAHPDVSIGTGMPVLFAGLVALPFIYGIIRSINILSNLAGAMIEIEKNNLATPLHATFDKVGPPSGWDPRKLIVRTWQRWRSRWCWSDR